MFTDFEKDLPDIRTIDLDNNKIYIKKQGQYGLWYVNFDKGQIPKELKSAFTSPDMAERAINLYLARKGREKAVKE